MEDTVIKAVKRYNYRIIARSKDKSRIKSIISLYGENGPLGNIYFVEASDVPNAVKREDNFELYYHYEDFPAIIDMMRNEESIFLVWQGPEDSLISTASEPFER